MAQQMAPSPTTLARQKGAAVGGRGNKRIVSVNAAPAEAPSSPPYADGWTQQRSREAMDRARQVIPGGVNSPLRAFSTVGKEPIVFESVDGSRAYDVDGNEYIDYVGSWGPAVVGHANPRVTKALEQQLQRGTSFGAPCELETQLATMVCDMVPSCDMVRMCNSGTEACLSAVRTMRAYTGKDKIIKFDGNYHGHVDSLLVQTGSGAATLGTPNSPGVPAATTASTVSAIFNDVDSVREAVKNHSGELAGIILEPIVGNSGYIPPRGDFLAELRKICDEENMVLCFDEVMTGFRIALGGAQEYYGVTPDLTAMGKVIGGGLPVGAFGGKQEIMNVVAPLGPMYQAGTLSGNPLAMTAGIETLKQLQEPGVFGYLTKLTTKLSDGMLDLAHKHGHAACGGGTVSMFGMFFTEGPVKNIADAKKSDLDKFYRWHQGMLSRGFYLAPAQFEAGFMSTAHTEEDIDKTLDAADDVLSKI